MSQGKVVQFPVPAPDELPFVEPSGWESEPPPDDFRPTRASSGPANAPAVAVDPSGANRKERRDRPRRSVFLVASFFAHALLLWLAVERGFDVANWPIDQRATEIPIELVDAPPPPPLPEAVKVESVTAAPVENMTEIAPLLDDQTATLVDRAEPPQADADEPAASDAASSTVLADFQPLNLSHDDLAPIEPIAAEIADMSGEEQLAAVAADPYPTTLLGVDTVERVHDVKIAPTDPAVPSRSDPVESAPSPEAAEATSLEDQQAVAVAETHLTTLVGIDPIQQVDDSTLASTEASVRADLEAALASAKPVETRPDASITDLDAVSAVDQDATPTSYKAGTTEADRVEDTESDARTLYGSLLREHLVEHGALAADGRSSSLSAAIVIFTVDRRGNPSRIRLSKSSGSKKTDDEARRIVVDAAPFPPFPSKIKSNTLIVRIPVRLSADR